MNNGRVSVMSSTLEELTVEAMAPNHLSSSQARASPVRGLSISRETCSTTLSQCELDSVKLGVEGWASLSAGVGSQRNLQEYFQESTAANEDSHLVEFSDALQTVARALRQVAESKARAQDEASEWKRKYELEVVRCQQLKQIIAKTMSVDVKQDEGSKTVVVDGTEQQESESPNGIHSSPSFDNGICCSKEGICSQQVIREQGTASSSPESEDCSDKKICSEKASFHLAWGCTGTSSRRHKHDIVSFESGNITTAVRNSKQITLQWDAPPQSVFILTKPNSTSVANLCREMVRWLKDVKHMRVFVEKNVKKELVEEDSYYSFLQAWEGKVMRIRDTDCSFDIADEELLILHTKIDLVITLGGDGTVLWAANMFKGPVPPLVSFSMGSLGFMTPFQSDRYKECIETVMKGPVYITLRHRLHCRIIRNKVSGGDEAGDDEVDHLVLNEISIDRGMSSYLTNLECYCDNLFVTCVQGDGLILSTPSGSTAYSLAAGGSMVHPQVPGILFTPICPHSLSFRPLILPEHVTLRVQIPVNSRGQAWASFDGKDRQQLGAGDALIVHMSAWPVPAACDEESTNDFLRSVREGLHWNLRKSQSFDGPRDGPGYNN